MAYFRHDGQRLAYTVYGRGARCTVLLPGILMSQKMQEPLARALVHRGNRVITFDPLGHGASDRPRDMWRYSMSAFGEQTLALLDHLELEHAVVGGASLGANITLELAAIAPHRLRGMLLEMPVLDNAIPACAAFFTPLLFGLTFGAPLAKLLSAGARAVPRRGMPFPGEVLLDACDVDPWAASALVQGVIFGRIAPHRRIRRTFDLPALVIGHRRDPIHPFSDADMLARELPNARLLNAGSILELRMRPERLTRHVATFVDQCWEGYGLAQQRHLRAAGA